MQTAVGAVQIELGQPAASIAPLGGPRAVRPLVLALASLLVTGPAAAGVYYTTDLEAVALGQGGAFIAAPTTLAAAWYNPAGLAQQRGLRFELETGFVYSPLTFDRRDADPSVVYPRVENRDPFVPVGFAGVSHDFGLPELTVGIFAYVPSSNHFAYDPAGPQRFQGVGGSFELAFLHAAVAYRLPGGVALGVALGPTYFTARQKNVVSVAPFGDPESELWTVPVEIDAPSPLFLSFNFGASYRPFPSLAIGASVMPRFDVKGSGHVDFTLPPFVAALATVQGNGLDISLDFPTIVRLGVRWWPRPALSVELAGVYEGWSRLQAVGLYPSIVVNAPSLGYVDYPLPDLSLTKHYRDVISARAGGEVTVRPWLVARAGAFFESAGSRPQRFDITAPEADKLGLTLGASVKIGRAVYVDVAYAHTFAPEVVVTDSEQSLLNALEEENTKVVGNGRYRFSYDSLHLGVRVELGQR